MKFGIYLKSHTTAPDYEDSCEANSKEQAIDYFMEFLGKYDWDREEVSKNVEEIHG